ncbi:uncharacterized protein LOC135222732 isoform X3 [Macrobrachium nipponense]|uniref:uncharacterized protein LOC135222732 isoform X3 n=1 Tax=Macrobrachium nipponense TaxID=159736 RepID=UPI0030C847D3
MTLRAADKYKPKRILSEDAVPSVFIFTKQTTERNLSKKRLLPNDKNMDIITADSIIDSSSIYENDFGDDEDSMEKAPPVLSMKNTSKMTSLPSTSVTSTRRPYRPGPACSKRRRRPNPISVREEYVEDEFEAFGKSVSAQLRKLSLSRALRVQTEIQKILTEEKINDIGIITNLQAVPSPTPPELVAPTFKPVASMYEPVVSAKLPEVSSSDTKGANVDSGFDSGVESTSTKSISGSTARFDDIKTESIKDEPILETEEKMSTSPSASGDGKSLPLQEQMEELKAPGCVQPKDEIIHNEECEIVTLDEDDPLKGTGDLT